MYLHFYKKVVFSWPLRSSKYVYQNQSKLDVMEGIDSKMTSEAYIVPGLGDAGDLAFGKKEDE